MPKLKRISGKEAVSILKKFGFGEIRQKGSHTELAIGTLRGILRQAKVKLKNLRESYNNLKRIPLFSF